MGGIVRCTYVLVSKEPSYVRNERETYIRVKVALA